MTGKKILLLIRKIINIMIIIMLTYANTRSCPFFWILKKEKRKIEICENHGGFASNPIRPRVVSPIFPFRSGRFASIFFSKCKYSVIVKVLCFHT
jgi:hypothetical protein